MRLIPTAKQRAARPRADVQDLDINENVLVSIQDLRVDFKTNFGVVHAVDGVSIDIHRHETVALVGESGCGKSVTSLSLLKLVSYPGEIVGGKVIYNGGDTPVDITALNDRDLMLRRTRGREIGIIFQEPMTSMSALHTIGSQLVERVRVHESDVTKQQARERAIELLHDVGLPNPRDLIDMHTFELSGGMRQRAMIAMALVSYPSLLIADEPTTALDVTVQAQILELIGRIKEDYNMSVLNVTHDLGVVSELADRVVVMYLGRIMEIAEVKELFRSPAHPYTQALLRSIPSYATEPKARLPGIRGSVPPPHVHMTACRFADRCDFFMKGLCDVKEPELIELTSGTSVRCHLYTQEGKSYDREAPNPSH